MSETTFGPIKKVSKSPVPERCEFCKHFGPFHGEWTACYDVSLLKLLFEGPDIVSPNGSCARFECHKKFLQRSR